MDTTKKFVTSISKVGTGFRWLFFQVWEEKKTLVETDPKRRESKPLVFTSKTFLIKSVVRVIVAKLVVTSIHVSLFALYDQPYFCLGRKPLNNDRY